MDQIINTLKNNFLDFTCVAPNIDESRLLNEEPENMSSRLAIEKAKTMDSGLIVVILPDGGEKYLSTTLYEA